LDVENAVEVVDEDIGETLSHGSEGGIGKRAGDDAAEDRDDFGDCRADALLGDFLAEHGGDLLHDGVPDSLGKRLVRDLIAGLRSGHAGGLIDEGSAASNTEHGAEVAEDANLCIIVEHGVVTSEEVLLAEEIADLLSHTEREAEKMGDIGASGWDGDDGVSRQASCEGYRGGVAGVGGNETLGALGKGFCGEDGLWPELKKDVEVFVILEFGTEEFLAIDLDEGELDRGGDGGHRGFCKDFLVRFEFCEGFIVRELGFDVRELDVVEFGFDAGEVGLGDLHGSFRGGWVIELILSRGVVVSLTVESLRRGCTFV